MAPIHAGRAISALDVGKMRGNKQECHVWVTEGLNHSVWSTEPSQFDCGKLAHLNLLALKSVVSNRDRF